MGTTRRSAILSLVGLACAAPPAAAGVSILTLLPGALPPDEPAKPAEALTGITPKDLEMIDRTSSLTTAGLPDRRGLWITNPNTNEELVTLFWDRGQSVNRGYSDICKILRDWRENEVMAMDPHLLHLLWSVQRQAGFKQPLRIVSGFRTVRTSALTPNEGNLASLYHMQSSACDIDLEGTNPERVAEAVHALKRGGVGLYKTYTHIDTGPVRHWQG